MGKLFAVEATEEKYRILKHEPTGARFDAEGKSQWPMDSFTHRLIEEGSVRLSAEETKPAPAVAAPDGKATTDQPAATSKEK